jgi:hypothetical protein
MNLAPNKKDIGDYFVTWGWLIILFIGLSYVVWYWPISAIDSIKDYEQINFFFESYGLNDNTLQSDLLADLQEKGVVEVNLYDYAPTDVSLTSYYDEFGVASDFIVLTESGLDSMFNNASSTGVTSKFVPFSIDLRTATMPTDDYEYYKVGNIAYGLKIFDSSDSSYDEAHPFGRLLEFASTGIVADSYYLLLNSATPNFKPFDADSVTSNAVEALRYFLAKYR